MTSIYSDPIRLGQHPPFLYAAQYIDRIGRAFRYAGTTAITQRLIEHGHDGVVGVFAKLDCRGGAAFAAGAAFGSPYREAALGNEDFLIPGVFIHRT